MARRIGPVLKTPAKAAKYQRRYAEILDAAAAVFAEKGFHGASTKDIADRLGIRQGSLYYYFSSKEDALEEVCRIGVEGFVNRLAIALAGPGNARDKLRAAVRNHLFPMRDRPDYVRTFLKERYNLNGDNYLKVRDLARRYEAMLESLVENGITEGEFRADQDCRTTVLGFLGMWNAVADWLVTEPDHSLDEIAERYADLALGGVAVAS